MMKRLLGPVALTLALVGLSWGCAPKPMDDEYSETQPGDLSLILDADGNVIASSDPPAEPAAATPEPPAVAIAAAPAAAPPAAAAPAAAPAAEADKPDAFAIQWLNLTSNCTVELFSGLVQNTMTLTGRLDVPNRGDIVSYSQQLEVSDVELVDAQGKAIFPLHNRADIRQAFRGKSLATQNRQRTFNPAMNYGNDMLQVTANINNPGPRPARIKRLQGFATVMLVSKRESKTLAADGSDGVVEMGGDLSVWIEANPKKEGQQSSYVVNFRKPAGGYENQYLPPAVTSVSFLDDQGRPLTTNGSSGYSMRNERDGSMKFYLNEAGDRTPKKVVVQAAIEGAEQRVPFLLLDVPLP